MKVNVKKLSLLRRQMLPVIATKLAMGNRPYPVNGDEIPQKEEPAPTPDPSETPSKSMLLCETLGLVSSSNK